MKYYGCFYHLATEMKTYYWKAVSLKREKKYVTGHIAAHLLFTRVALRPRVGDNTMLLQNAASQH